MKIIGLETKIDEWLCEDMPYIDITTDNLELMNREASAQVSAKAKGIVAGTEVFAKVFERISPEIRVELGVKDGQRVSPGDIIATVTGPAPDMLKGERLALNLLQRMSGVATLTGSFVEAVEGTGVKIVDTRKTTPGLRSLEKYAVTMGGGFNHRYSLSDAVMIKDNHIKASGTITKAVRMIRGKLGHTVKVEVEATCLKEVMEAVDAGADIIMLDNMGLEEMREAVRAVGESAVLEASGGVDLKTVRAIAETGVDVISVGAVTHSYAALDISMNMTI